MLRTQKAVAVLMSSLLVLTTIPIGASAQNASPYGTQEEYGTLSAELDGNVAPIALYPDALVAQILGAATFHYKIVDARDARLCSVVRGRSGSQNRWAA
jgi:hypothetical protein